MLFYCTELWSTLVVFKCALLIKFDLSLKRSTSWTQNQSVRGAFWVGIYCDLKNRKEDSWHSLDNVKMPLFLRHGHAGP